MGNLYIYNNLIKHTLGIARKVALVRRPVAEPSKDLPCRWVLVDRCAVIGTRIRSRSSRSFVIWNTFIVIGIHIRPSGFELIGLYSRHPAWEDRKLLTHFVTFAFAGSHVYSTSLARSINCVTRWRTVAKIGTKILADRFQRTDFGVHILQNNSDLEKW